MRLGNICSYLHRGKSPQYGEHKVLPIIAQKCNQWDMIYTDRCLFSSTDSIKKYKEEQFLQIGDVIINSTGGGTVGRTGYIDSYVFEQYSRYVADSHVTVVRPLPLILQKYIYYFLISPQIQIGLEDRCSGSTNQIELGTNTIYNYLTPVPPIREQRRIVEKIQEVLPVVDNYGKTQIALDKLNADIFDKLKKSVLQEAIQGKLVSQNPKDEPASVLLERIKAEKAKLFKEGNLKKKDLVDSVIFKGEDNKYYEKIGSQVACIDDEIPFEIPANWEWVRLGTLYQHNTGKALNGANQKGVAYEYITTSNLYWNYFVLDKLRTMPFTDEELEKCTVKKGDLLVCEGGDIGRSAIWNFDYDIRIQNHIHRLRPYAPLGSLFFYYVLYLYKHIGLIGGKGIGIQGLSSNALHRLLLPLPSIAEQERIVDKIEFVIASITRR